MRILSKKVVELGRGLHPLFAVLTPLALGMGVEHLDDLARFDGVVIDGAGADLVGDGLAVAQAVQGDVFVFVLAVDGEDIVIGGGEAGIGVLKVAEIILLCFQLLRNCQRFIQQIAPNLL